MSVTGTCMRRAVVGAVTAAAAEEEGFIPEGEEEGSLYAMTDWEDALDAYPIALLGDPCPGSCPSE